MLAREVHSFPSQGASETGELQPLWPVGSAVLSVAMPTSDANVTTSLRELLDQTACGLQVPPHLADLMMERLLQLWPCLSSFE